jgi:hypothetical protein
MRAGNDLRVASVRCEPEFFRAPARGPDPLFGLTRPHLYRLLARGEIRGVTLREPGRAYGVRLFSVPSVRSFIERMARLNGDTSAAAGGAS